MNELPDVYQECDVQDIEDEFSRTVLAGQAGISRDIRYGYTICRRCRIRVNQPVTQGVVYPDKLFRGAGGSVEELGEGLRS